MIADVLALLGEALTGAASVNRVGLEQGLKVIVGIPIARRDEAPVDVERRRGAGMSEPVGHGAKVDARGQQLGGDKVP